MRAVGGSIRPGNKMIAQHWAFRFAFEHHDITYCRCIIGRDQLLYGLGITRGYPGVDRVVDMLGSNVLRLIVKTYTYGLCSVTAEWEQRDGNKQINAGKQRRVAAEIQSCLRYTAPKIADVASACGK